MSSIAVSRPQRALRVLADLRARRRRLRGSDGLLRLAAGCFAGVWFTFLLDWTLELPVGIRLIHLIAAGVLLFIGLRVFFLSPRRRLTESQLAAQLELADGTLDQSVITAVQLTAKDNARAALYSPMLLARTVRSAEERVGTVRPAQLLSRRGMGTSFLIVVCLLVPLLIGAALRRDLAQTYVERDILLRDAPWPREYVLEVLEPAEQDILIAMGDSVPLLVRKIRGGDARVWLDTEFESGETERFPLEKKGTDQFRRVFRNVDRDFSFTVSAGDFRSATYSVRVRNRPRIEEIALSFDHPDYTGIPDVAEATASLGGHVKVPVGTVVGYRVRSSIAIKSATFVRSFRESNEEKETSAALDIVADRMLNGSFVADRNGSYHFRLVSEDDFENPNPIRYRIAVIPDDPPAVQIVKPGKNSEVSVRARFPIEIQTQDDYGVTTTAIVFQAASDEGDSGMETRVAIETLEVGTRSGGAILDFDLEKFESDYGGWKPEEESRIQYYAESVDAVGQIGTSRTFSLTIVSEDDLHRIIQDDISIMSERVAGVREMQEESRRELQDVLDQTRLSAGRVPDEQLPNVRHARRAQENIRLRLEESQEGFLELIDRIQENRLTGVKELPWIQEIEDELGNIVENEAPRALDALRALADAATDMTAREEDVDAAIATQAQVEQALEELLTKLQKWGDLRTVIRKLEDLKRKQEEVLERVKDRAKGDAADPDGDDRR